MWAYTTFLCTKFQGNWTTCFPFMITFHTLMKRKERNKETKPIFWKFVSRKPLAWFSWNSEFGVLTVEVISTAKSSSFVQVTQSYICTIIVLLFFLSVYLLEVVRQLVRPYGNFISFPPGFGAAHFITAWLSSYTSFCKCMLHSALKLGLWPASRFSILVFHFTARLWEKNPWMNNLLTV